MGLNVIMKKGFVIVLIFCIVIMTVLYGMFSYYQNEVVKHPFTMKNDKVQVFVKQGESLYGVIDNLGQNGIIHNAFFMKYYIKKNALNSDIKPGNYSFDPNTNINELINYLNKGAFDNDIVMVTIPEGYDIEQIADTLDKKGIISRQNFILSCKEYTFPGFIKADSKKKYVLEGYLFPDTYALTKGMMGKTIIDIMLNRFQDVMADVEKAKNMKINNSDLEKYIVMASIVEREVKVSDERGKAASVFYNRLKVNMKLESCATVEYALGFHKDKLLNSDLRINSPYNTYIVAALPIGPICSPGRQSIEAALKPDQTNYLYFVSNNDGTHTFTDSYKKFLEVKKVTQGF